MHDTYDSGAEAETDRTQQKALLAALGAWDRALRRDECGAWCIGGKHGKAYTWGDGRTWVLWVGCRSGQHWTHTKKRLDFCAVTQDGWDEGCLRLHHMPTPEQAEELRQVLGIRKRMEFAPDDLERRKTSMARLALAKIFGSPGSPVPEPTPEPEPILDAEPANVAQVDAMAEPGAVPVEIISDKVEADGVRRITRQHGPIPIHSGNREAIELLHRTMTDEQASMEDRLEAARTLAPYFHPTSEIIEINSIVKLRQETVS